MRMQVYNEAKHTSKLSNQNYADWWEVIDNEIDASCGEKSKFIAIMSDKYHLSKEAIDKILEMR